MQEGFNVHGHCIFFLGLSMFLNGMVSVLLTLGSLSLFYRGHTDTAARRRH